MRWLAKGCSMIAQFVIGFVVLIVDVLLAVVLGRMAEDKGYSFSLGFFLGVLTSPLVGWLVVLMLPERPRANKLPPQLQLELELERAKQEAAKPVNERKSS